MNEQYYKGKGTRNTTPIELPTIDHDSQSDPEGYLATPELAAAVDTAITLGMPLLLTGEPGSGKTSLAKSIAWEVLGEDEIPLSFTVKSDTRARDLFYRFDTIGRFHASNIKKEDISPQRFISFEAIGKAILQAKPLDSVQELLKEDSYVSRVHNGTQKRNVVLIDEIDKAPRDVPNDILVEIENLCFDIPEMDKHISLKKSERMYQPIVIITSNAEKSLPEAFLRRCVFHHLQFPPFEGDENATGTTVNDIVAKRIGNRYQETPHLLKQAISWFKFLRFETYGEIERKPSLAELLDWLNYLAAHNTRGTDANEKLEFLRASTCNLLLKNLNDRKQCKKWLEQWLEQSKKIS